MEMFCPDTPSFCDHIWSCVELSGDLSTKDDAGALQCVIGHATSLYLVMLHLFTEDEVELKPFPMKSLLPSDLKSYWRYNGSFTTPACYESVIWTVFQSPIEVSSGQVRFLTSHEVENLCNKKYTVTIH